MASDEYELDLFLHHETEKAIKVSDSGDEEDAVWLPRSQVQIMYQRDDLITVVMSEKLAQEKELV